MELGAGKKVEEEKVEEKEEEEKEEEQKEEEWSGMEWMGERDGGGLWERDGRMNWPKQYLPTLYLSRLESWRGAHQDDRKADSVAPQRSPHLKG